mmetsp:Transcript_32996/g.43428  ORF Transcript_32996/g.43428 Transcript_32996/m.43428 type:complete len:520 (+) Transcript_32996:186-1745(+)
MDDQNEGRETKKLWSSLRESILESTRSMKIKKMNVKGGPIFLGSDNEMPMEWKRSLLLHSSPDLIQQNLQLLQNLGEGTVIFLISQGKEMNFEWEEKASQFADNLIFWLPENTTDEELARWSLAFGDNICTGKVIYGREEGKSSEEQKNVGEIQKKFGTLDLQAKAEQVPVLTSFEDCINAFEEKTKGAQMRKGGERYVPLHMWKHPAFQDWYNNLVKEGNELKKARYAYDFRVGPGKKFLLYWTIYADIYIKDEDRLVEDKVVLGRTSIKCVFPYYMPEGDDVSPLDCEVVLVKEFRSPACTDDCFIYELPGGSAFKPIDPEKQAQTELREEVGIRIPDDNLARIHLHGPKQLANTISVHQAYLFSVSLNEKEINDCRKRAAEQEALGVEEDTERTYTVVMTLGEALSNLNLIDWSMLGMMHSVLIDALKEKRDQNARMPMGKLNKDMRKSQKKIAAPIMSQTVEEHRASITSQQTQGPKTKTGKIGNETQTGKAGNSGNTGHQTQTGKTGNSCCVVM